MKSQQEAERAEQQRIKNLVLNYDMQDSGDTDGTGDDFNSALSENPNLSNPLAAKKTVAYTNGKGIFGDKRPQNASLQTQSSTASHGGGKAAEKPSTGNASTGRGHRARKLQLSDVDWYAPPSAPTKHCESPRPRGYRGRGRSTRGRNG